MLILCYKYPKRVSFRTIYSILLEHLIFEYSKQHISSVGSLSFVKYPNSLSLSSAHTHRCDQVQCSWNISCDLIWSKKYGFNESRNEYNTYFCKYLEQVACLLFQLLFIVWTKIIIYSFSQKTVRSIKLVKIKTKQFFQLQIFGVPLTLVYCLTLINNFGTYKKLYLK